MTDQELVQAKDVEMYAASVNAWINTGMEHDRSLLTLAAAGIGLLITLLTAFGVGEVTLLVLYVVALLAFVGTVVTVLVVFKRNKTHIGQVVHGNDAPDPILTALDYTAVGTFGVGVILTAVIGVSTAVTSYSKAERERMTRDNTRDSSSHQDKSLNNLRSVQVRPQERSVNDLGSLRVTPPAETSINNIGTLRPAPAAPVPALTPTSTPAAAPAQPASGTTSGK